jgi:purine-binding chemotaxis protein CheW
VTVFTRLLTPERRNNAMDLADIRKKAGIAAEGPTIPVDEVSIQAAVVLSAGEVASDSPPVEPFPSDFMEGLLPEEGLQPDDVPSGMDEEKDDSLLTEEAIPAFEPEEYPVEENLLDDLDMSEEISLAREEVSQPGPSREEQLIAQPCLQEEPVPLVSFTSYNPLSVLLAGRAALLDEENEDRDRAETEYVEEALLEYLCFRVSHELYAVNILEIKEIIKPREWTEVPRAPHFVCGVISLRGVIIPVFDMRLRLGLPEVASTGKERIIVVRDKEGFCGILVDEVIQVVRIPVTSIEPAPAVLEGIDRDFVLGIGRQDGNMLILLSLENILDLTIV